MLLKKKLNEDYKFKLNLEDLINLEGRDLIEWKNNYEILKAVENEKHPLDVLYEKKNTSRIK
ncbi:hypothetical protein [Flavobacterium sp. CSZ]|uniref:hypothetical protein n=1 Tax=Flavobacterium sp. CSZ TaxID=2783791 RepID=UPI00188C1B5A|nr:hypothetical protein [Flavobacterium sp. CSZ]MBF4487733.1 hypothetical protein [Flavobacterium sp. CSZ]